MVTRSGASRKCVPKRSLGTRGGAGLYRYATEADSRRGESPLGQDDHAMDALRYLIASIDERKLGRRRKIGDGTAEEEPKERKWLSLYNEALWTPVCTVWR